MNKTQYRNTVAIASIGLIVLAAAVMYPDRDRSGDRNQPLLEQPFDGFTDQPGNATRPGSNPVGIVNEVRPRQVLQGESVAIEQLPATQPVIYAKLERLKQLESLPAYLAIDELAQMAESADPFLRYAAIKSVGEIGGRASLTLLAGALNDAEAEIRIAALEGLALQSASQLPALAGALLYDTDRSVRIAAVEALSVMRDEQAAIALSGLIVDGDVDIRRQAVYALGEIGGEIAVAYLEQARHDPDEDIRASAAEILRESGIAPN